MVTIKKKQFFFTLTENWFEYKFKWIDLIKPVCYRGLREANHPKFFGIKKHTNTVVLPLDEPIEIIHANFSTSHKRNIKKSVAEGVECHFNNNRKEFIDFYNVFANEKKLMQLDISRASEYEVESWKCSYAVLNGEILVAHSYIEDIHSGIVRLMESGSMRLNSNYNPSNIADANKLLHYFDIKYFKERGLKFYDLGGWDDLPGLLYFKKSFGAYPIDVYNYFSYTYAIKEKIKELAMGLKKLNPVAVNKETISDKS